MKDYDPTKPLIAIHIPKAAGTTTQQLYEQWFGTDLLTHYYDERTGTPPVRRDLAGLQRNGQPIVLYGHFNRLRGFGVEDYYPEVDQFITIIRDPFEQTLSRYFFLRKHAGGWHDPSRQPQGDLPDFVLATEPTMLNHFPRQVTMGNYRDIIETYFVEIGIAEQLDESMRRIAAKLGKAYDGGALQHLNATERDQKIPQGLKERFIDKHALHYAVYDYVRGRFDGRRR